MKTAIYIEDGVTQVVLTPENDFEKSVIGVIGDGLASVKLFSGSFYDCRGGWVRQSPHYSREPFSREHGYGKDASIMIRVDRAAPAAADEPPLAVELCDHLEGFQRCLLRRGHEGAHQA